MDEATRQKLVEVFDLEMFRTGRHVGKRSKKELGVRFLWAATIIYFVPTITVAVVHTQEGCKGVLLVPPLRWPRNREFAGSSPIRPVDLIDWTDSVETALATLDLKPSDGGPTYGDGAYSFDFTAETRDFSVNIGLTNGPLSKPHLDSLGESLLKTTTKLAHTYNHPEINLLFKLNPFQRGWRR